MQVDGVHHRTVSWNGAAVCMIDQTVLPFEFRTVDLKSVEEVAMAIETMIVRGAPAIGATAAYGMALAAGTRLAAGGRYDDLRKDEARLAGTRPTAVNLHDGLARMRAALKLDTAQGPVDAAAVTAARTAAQDYADEDAERCRAIGEAGAELIPQGGAVLTHCNAGWLATVDWGTALAPIYVAHRNGRKPRVWADETRPRGQGRSLTAWELGQEGVPVTVIADGAAASLLASGRVDLVITGSDRIAANGDVANKIGTYGVALAAAAAGVPFYVAAPHSTVDHACPDGPSIPIEERSPEEVSHVTGIDDDGVLRRVRVLSPGASAANQAFDVTPAALVAKFITEYGLLEAGPEGIAQWRNRAG